MLVIPRVHQGDVVRLEVSQEVSSLVNGNVAGAADLITNRRSLRTTVLADNGGTIVLGGLIRDDLQSAENKVPIVGDVPVIGRLFQSDGETSSKRTLSSSCARPSCATGPMPAQSRSSAMTAYRHSIRWSEIKTPCCSKASPPETAAGTGRDLLKDLSHARP